MHIPLSPLLLGSLIAAGAGTVLLLSFLVIQFQAEPPKSGPPGVGNTPPPLPPPAHLAFFVATAIFAIAWLAVLTVGARDQLIRRLDVMEARLIELTQDYGEHRRTDGYVEGVHEATRTDSPTGGPSSRLRSLPPRE
jgi:hypothetical protein